MQALGIDIVGDFINGFDAGNDAVFENTERGHQLIAAGGRERMTDIGLDRTDRPMLNTESACDLIQNQGFGHSILWCARTVSLHETALTHRVAAQNRDCRSHRLGHRDVVARTRSGYGFFVAIGINENITYRTMNIRAELNCQCIIHQHYILR